MTGTMGGLRGARAPLSTVITAAGTSSLDINALIGSGYTMLRAQLLAGGTGGGSGRRGAAATIRGGGGGGVTGSYTDLLIPIASLLAAFPTGLVPYNVGAGTAGGAAATVNDTNGNPGTVPTQAVNGTWLGAAPGGAHCFAVARANGAGNGGTATGASAGSGGAGGTAPSFAGNPSSATGGGGSASVTGAAGSGGGISAADAASAGGSPSTLVTGTPAGVPIFSGGIQGTGGVVDAAVPTSGTAPDVLIGPGPPPGGGASSITTAGQAGANGMANSGTGGGGGGASLNGNNSGAGGDGGSGFARFTAF